MARRLGFAGALFFFFLLFGVAITAPAERLDGINLDIEPHLLDSFQADEVGHGVLFLDLSVAFGRLLIDSGQALDVGPAIPFWFDSIEDVSWHGQTKRRVLRRASS